METTERWLTKGQVAEKLSLSTRSIDRMVAEGKFPRGSKVNRIVRWPETAIDHFIAKQHEQANDA